MSNKEWVNETGIRDFTGAFGFTYKIEYTDNTVYFGKKNFTILRTLPPLKGKKRKRKKTLESNWRTYEGSSDWGKFKTIAKKSIIGLAYSKGSLTYSEVELLVKERVLFRVDCLNNNISGKFYRSNVGGKPNRWKTTNT